MYRPIQKRHSVCPYEDRAALVACMGQRDNPFGVLVQECTLFRQSGKEI